MNSLFNYAIGPSSTVNTYYPQTVFEPVFSCCKSGTTTQEDGIKPYIIFAISREISTLKKLLSTSNISYEFNGEKYDLELDVYSDDDDYDLRNNFANVNYYKVQKSNAINVQYSVTKIVPEKTMVLVPFGSSGFTSYKNVIIANKQYSKDLKYNNTCQITDSYYVGLSNGDGVSLSINGAISTSPITSINGTSNTFFNNIMFKTISLQEQTK